MERYGGISGHRQAVITPRLLSCPWYHVRQRTAFSTSAMADSEFMVTTARRPLDDVGFRTQLAH